MLAHLAGVIPQQRLAHRLVRFRPVEIGVDRHFRIDDDRRVVGEQHAHVGRESPAVAVGGRILLDEVAIRQHAGALEHRAQLHFAPSAPLVRRFQRADQASRLLPQELLRLGDRPEVAGQREALLVGVAKVFVEPPERVAQGLDEGTDFLLPRVEVRLRALLGLIRARPVRAAGRTRCSGAGHLRTARRSCRAG